MTRRLTALPVLSAAARLVTSSWLFDYKAFDADRLVKDLPERGSKVVIPPRSNRKATREYGKEMYKWRRPAENFFRQLKAFKKVAMRAGKTDSSFSANIYLAATHRLTIMPTVPRIGCRVLKKCCFAHYPKNPAVAGFGFAGNGGASNHEVHQFAGYNDAFFRRFALGVARHVGMGEGGGNDGVVIRIRCHADFRTAFAVNLHGERDVVLL